MAFAPVFQRPFIATFDRRAAAAALAPTAGMLAWWKADALALSDGDAVSAWTDSSGNGYHAAQIDGAKQPIYKTNIQGGKPVIRFDGSNDKLTSTANLGLGAGNFSLFWVAKAAVVTGYHTPIHIGKTSFFSGVIVATDGTSNDGTVLIGRIGGNFINTTSPANMASWHMYSLVRSGSTVYLFSSGLATTPASGDPGVMNIDTNFTIGDYASGGQLWNGDIAEILIYATALSDANRQTVEAYLASKYAL